VRLVADLIRGKSVPAAQRALAFLPKKSAPAVGKLLSSALANARALGTAPEQLFVKSIMVNKGSVQKRGRPFARGRSGVIRKTMSHVTLELGTMQKTANPENGFADGAGRNQRTEKSK